MPEIRSVLVNVDLSNVDSTALHYAIDLAGMLEAELTGVAAEDPGAAAIVVGDTMASFELYDAARQEIVERLVHARAKFTRLVPPHLNARWSGQVGSAVQALVDAARSADVIVTGHGTRSVLGTPSKVDVGELVLASGRPVIAVGERANSARIENVVIAWKDTREARRAVTDTLPLLQRARTVAAVTISEEEYGAESRSLADLGAWLGRHGVAACCEVIRDRLPSVDAIAEMALEREADLVVSGAYGHGRLREWLFGGVTRSLLEASTLSRAFSH